MKLRAALVTTVLVLAIVFPLSTASAESIAIQSGSMVVVGGFRELPTLELQGTHGFGLIAIPEIISASGPWQCRPCGEDGFIQVSNLQGGSDLPGTVEFEGTQIRLLFGNDASIELNFLADDLIAPPASSTLQTVLSEPFNLAGSLHLPDVGGIPQHPVNLFGRGTFTIELLSRFDAWEFQRLSFVFGSPQPAVPEPPTILLVVGGMIAAIGRRMRAGRST